MDDNMKNVISKKINRVENELKRNNMEFYYAETKEDVLPIVESLLQVGDVVASGGSVTLKQCGIIDFLKTGNYKYLDRNSVSGDEIDKLYRESLSTDAYFCSANAITENGELYNVDGNSNRIAAICYGPKSVIVIAGYNKIVANIDEAVKRVKSLTAPINCQRLNCETYCHETGECVSLKRGNAGIGSGCDSDSRICCNYLISARQRHKNRIKVILVGEQLGY